MSEVLAARVRNISRLIYGAIALLVLVGDQATKAIVESALPQHEVIPVIPGFFNIIHVQNEGAAFGLFADSPAPWKTALLIVVSAALLATVVGVVWKSRQLHWEAGVGLSLILGGALSNLLDRIRTGRVIDFLDFYIKNYHWYTFNLADSSIVAGAGFLILQVLFSE
jgi:signal peptidase II